ncbi:hypothetical protein Trydic_g1141 [Trypoxylus dichotomus]
MIFVCSFRGSNLIESSTNGQVTKTSDIHKISLELSYSPCGVINTICLLKIISIRSTAKLPGLILLVINMLRLLIISACFFAGTFAAPGKDFVSDISTSGIGQYGGGYGGKGFSAGSGLKAIAQGSAEQANNAVTNQHTAARQAAFSAKSSLAQAAVGAAATAQAALIGKQILVQKLEGDVNEAHQQVQAELQQLEQAERSANAAQQAYDQAQQQVNALSNALNGAQGAGSHAQQAAEEALAELGSQEAMVGAAKQRLSVLTQELHAAEADLQATQSAAQQAESAAQIAQSNAAQAAESASAAGLDHAGNGGGSYGLSGDFAGYHH